MGRVNAMHYSQTSQLKQYRICYIYITVMCNNIEKITIKDVSFRSTLIFLLHDAH